MLHEYKNFISQKYIQTLLTNIASVSLSQMDVLGSDNSDKYRVAQWTWLNSKIYPDYINLLQKISDLIGVQSEQCENLHVVKYLVWGEYKYHHDFFHPNTTYYDTEMKKWWQRIKTALIYLNTTKNWTGWTHFQKLDKLIKPEAGKLVYWDNVDPITWMLDYDSIHAWLPVDIGEKIVLITFVRENTFNNQ